MIGGMTLRALLERHGILSIRELTRRCPKISRQVGWNLWHGYTGIGKKWLKEIHQGTGISYEELLEVDSVPHTQRPTKGARSPRRRQPPEEDAGASHEPPRA